MLLIARIRFSLMHSGEEKPTLCFCFPLQFYLALSVVAFCMWEDIWQNETFTIASHCAAEHLMSLWVFCCQHHQISIHNWHPVTSPVFESVWLNGDYKVALPKCGHFYTITHSPSKQLFILKSVPSCLFPFTPIGWVSNCPLIWQQDICQVSPPEEHLSLVDSDATR